MNKENLSSKIKSLRNRKGFSQEQLAENSSLSLRTVQRIENGETIPHGDSLRKLTQALGITPDDISDWAPTEDKGYLAIMNISALAFIFNPLLGIILPFILWTLKKDKIKFVDDSGKKMMNFQITWTILLYLFIFIASGGKYIRFDIKLTDWLPAFLEKITMSGFCLALFYLYNIALVILNLRKNSNGCKSKYIPSIPLLQ